MKNIFLTILLLFFCNSIISAQSTDKNSIPNKTANNLQVGFHLMNIEDDKFALDYLKLEYQRDLTRHSSFSSSIGFAAYTKHWYSKFFPSLHLPEEDIRGFRQDNNQSSLIIFNVNYVYQVLFSKKGNFVIKLGPTVSYLLETRNFGGRAQSAYTPNGTAVYQYTNYSSFMKGFDYGINYVVGYNFNLNRKFNLVTYINHQKYLGNVNPYVYAAGVEIGYKF